MQDLGLAVMVLPNPKDLNGMYANLKLVGIATGHETEAEDLVLSLQVREQKVLTAVAQVTERPLVFYELDGTDPSKPWTTGPGTFIDLLINLAGAQNAGAGLTGEWAQISLEELIVQDPAIILLGDANFGMTAEQVAARAGWDALTSVKENKVVPFNDDLASRPGPRLLDGLEEMVRIFHPELADQLN
jgi:iron complex transport system substrate-binding protein